MKFNRDIRDLVDMNLTKSAACKRAKCSPVTLDKECLKVFGMKWDDVKAQQRQSKNEALSSKPVGKVYYHGQRPVIIGGFR